MIENPVLVEEAFIPVGEDEEVMDALFSINHSSNLITSSSRTSKPDCFCKLEVSYLIIYIGTMNIIILIIIIIISPI